MIPFSVLLLYAKIFRVFNRAKADFCAKKCEEKKIFSGKICKEKGKKPTKVLRFWLWHKYEEMKYFGIIVIYT